MYISRKAGYATSQIHQLKRGQLRGKKRKVEGSFEIEEMIERNIDISPPVNAASEESVKSLIARIKELTKANGGLVKEVFKVRHEELRMHKQHQSITLQTSSKLSVVEDEL